MAVAERMEMLGKYISKLPNTEDVSRMMKNYYQSVYNGQLQALKDKIQSEHRALKADLTAHMDTLTGTMTSRTTQIMRDMEMTLKHRDMLPWKLKFK